MADRLSILPRDILGELTKYLTVAHVCILDRGLFCRPSKYITDSDFLYVTREGYLNPFIWLLSCRSGYHPATKTMCLALMVAAEYGRLNIIEWVYTHHVGFISKWSRYLTSDYVFLEAKRWFTKTDYLSLSAAVGGQLDVLKWAQQKGSLWSTSVCANAARHGHLNVLIWLRQNGCPWDEYTTYRAATTGRLEILKWAYENGCPLGEHIMTVMHTRPNKEITAWLISVGCRR